MGAQSKVDQHGVVAVENTTGGAIVRDGVSFEANQHTFIIKTRWKSIRDNDNATDGDITSGDLVPKEMSFFFNSPATVGN